MKSSLSDPLFVTFSLQGCLTQHRTQVVRMSKGGLSLHRSYGIVAGRLTKNNTLTCDFEFEMHGDLW